MLKKIFIAFGMCLVTAMFAAYFWWGSELVRKNRPALVCDKVCATVTDSALCQFVHPDQIVSMISNSPAGCIGKAVDSIDIFSIEESLKAHSEIKSAEAYVDDRGVVSVSISQRHPKIRIQGRSRAYYVDEEMTEFPLVSTYSAYVPLITGSVPDKPGKEWYRKMFALVDRIDADKELRNAFGQIHIESSGEVLLASVTHDLIIRIGRPDNLETKFDKLKSFYSNIAPARGWDRFNVVDLRFGEQIVCKNTNKI
ncbi:MAG: hypothetical protein HUJ89_01425 [Bacteroidales bacterium]|nr:hypothetical protein [Bacteroidales bacterium]